ncbi:MAG: hypothetical protein ABI591_03680 [Kofleriaceae bacterium]
MISWRTAAIVLATVCCIQRWQSCTRTESPRMTTATIVERAAAPRPSLREAVANSIVPNAPTKPARTIFGVHVPAWAARLLPQPGETMRDYRDRIVPLAQIVIAPQRARVARMRDNFTSLDEHQRAELDAAVGDAATAIEARVTSAIASGELQPSTLRPMEGVTMARELLDIVDQGNTRFTSSLRPDQRTELAANRFDFADYLLFSTRWEDALAKP